jgi:hypothetical protein
MNNFHQLAHTCIQLDDDVICAKNKDVHFFDNVRVEW